MQLILLPCPLYQTPKRRPCGAGVGVVGNGHQHIAFAAGTVHIACHRRHIAQTAGFEVGAAHRPGAAVFERAVHPVMGKEAISSGISGER